MKDKRLPKFSFKHVEVSYVKQEINKLKTSKSPGPDKIPIKILKDAVEIVSGPLTTIFNRSLDLLQASLSFKSEIVRRERGL